MSVSRAQVFISRVKRHKASEIYPQPGESVLEQFHLCPQETILHLKRNVVEPCRQPCQILSQRLVRRLRRRGSCRRNLDCRFGSICQQRRTLLWIVMVMVSYRVQIISLVIIADMLCLFSFCIAILSSSLQPNYYKYCNRGIFHSTCSKETENQS